MVVYDSGLRRSVFCALSPSEDGASYRRAIIAMKYMLPSTSDMKATVTDCSLERLNAFQAVYPEATVSFCRFHILTDMCGRCDSLSLTVEGGVKRTHQWMRNLDLHQQRKTSISLEWR